MYRIMRECGLSGKHPRKKYGNYKKVQQDLIKDNILMQNFSADMRNVNDKMKMVLSRVSWLDNYSLI